MPGVRSGPLLFAVQKLTRRRRVATFAAVPSKWRARPLGSVPMRSFIRCISGPRVLLSFPVDDGTEMMVTSTMLPSFSRTPRSVR